jgi:two-component system chemotaxis response regulator CheB
MAERIKVLIVDDSRIFRGALAEALAAEEGIEVIGSVFNGEKALEFLRTNPVDVVTLDVEMPGMDGVQTLDAIQKLNETHLQEPPVGVIMVSAFTQRGADVTVQALQAGAFDYVAKPNGPDLATNMNFLRQELVPKVRLCAKRQPDRVVPGKPSEELLGEGFPEEACTGRRQWFRSSQGRPVKAIVIAVSTGGPRALAALLPDLCLRVNVPILLVQHMGEGFTSSLAAQLARQTGRPVREARDGEPIQNGHIYVGPGGKHLTLRCAAGRLLTGVTEQPPEIHCRPSADVLFRTAAAALGGDVIALVLTGMGCDGTAGLAVLKRAGAYVIVQDEATSVVWGMPGSAVRAGLVDEILPLGEMASAIQALVTGRGSL